MANYNVDALTSNNFPQTFTFKVESCKAIPNPYLAKKRNDPNALPNAAMYIVLCDIQELPKERFPMETNPREQKMTTSVAKKIKETLFETENPVFYLLNRGILLSAESVKYDQYNQELTVVFGDPEVHGNVDGGHTYRAILDNRDKLVGAGGSPQYVKLEILTGVEDVFQRLAAARNTSVQVEDKSIAELEDRFDLIKDALQDAPFLSRIAFKENVELTNDAIDVDVKDVVAILNMFDLARFPDLSACPTISYSSPKKCVDYYIKYHKENESSGSQCNNPYYKMRKIMQDVFRLHDLIEQNMKMFYTKNNSSGRYGAIKGVFTPKDGETYRSLFFQNPLEYKTAKGLLIPILGAFRALLEEKDGIYVWTTDPFELLVQNNNELGSELVDTVISMHRSLGNNSNITGKNPNLWKQLAMLVYVTKIRCAI
ncbi:MAG: AIPR family protein [Thermoguttaceae bacterium]|nr:AIPR family protein [Thermoguttaceae bacterium]